MGDENMVTTIRFPRSVWSKLKYLQADGRIKNMQSAVMKGLEMYFGVLDREKDREKESEK